MSEASLPDVLPFEDSTIELYVTQLALKNASIGTVKGALSAIAWHHRAANLRDPTKSFATKRMLISLGRAAPAPRKADPLSLAMLEVCLDKICFLGLSSYEGILIKSLLIFMYYGCLRVGEVALSSNPDNILRLGNTEFVTLEGVRHFKFTLVKFKHSRGPVSLCIPPEPQRKFCPVLVLQDYLRARPRGGIHFFVTASSSPVPRSFVATQLAKLLELGGFTEGQFSSHSLRAGRATDLAAAGASDAEIRATGRWESDAFKGYLRFPILPQAGGPRVFGAGTRPAVP